jgi:hypothetical protein
MQASSAAEGLLASAAAPLPPQAQPYSQRVRGAGGAPASAHATAASRGLAMIAQRIHCIWDERNRADEATVLEHYEQQWPRFAEEAAARSAAAESLWEGQN